MEVMLRWVLFALLLGVCASARVQKKKKGTPHSLSRGWGDDIDWLQSYDEGLIKVAKGKKPLMVIHHKMDCQHCEALKKAFVADKLIQKMAKEDFLMLNLLEETTDTNLSSDGFYVPRIVFVDPSLTVRTDIVGKYHNRRYTYEPVDMVHLAENMKTAKALMHPEL